MKYAPKKLRRITRTLALAVGFVTAARFAMCNPASAEPPKPNQSAPNHDQVLGKPDIQVENASAQLKRSHVTGYLTRVHKPGESLLWCATMWSAWDSMSSLMKSPFRVAMNGVEPEMSLEMSRTPWPAGLLDDASYIAVVGYGPGTVATIEAEFKKKFSGAATPKILPKPESLKRDDILAYCYLFKNLQFDHPFDRSKKGLMFKPSKGSGAKVKSFRLDDKLENWSDVAKQVVVKRYAAPDDFVVEIATKQPDDRLIIARQKPAATLKDTVDAAMKSANSEESLPSPQPREEFEVPLMNFDVTRSFEEIVGAVVTTSGFADYRVAKALQNIRFKLDERGAVLKSEATIVVERTAAAPPKSLRRFVCDGPFLVLLARRGESTPYFAAWIENDELLTRMK